VGLTPDEIMARVTALVPHATAAPEELVRNQAVAIVPRERVLDALRALRDDSSLGFDVLADLTVVDYLGREPRFEVVYQLNSLTHHHRLRVKAGVPGDDPTIASATPLWNSALWAEREAWDLFGVRFIGHPDLRRILMYPEFEGHPLRKDYPVNKRQVLVPERDPIRRPWYPKQEGR
jgi:NADH-quinone oxidoreductase subunit C